MFRTYYTQNKQQLHFFYEEILFLTRKIINTEHSANDPQLKEQRCEAKIKITEHLVVSAALSFIRSSLGTESQFSTDPPW